LFEEAIALTRDGSWVDVTAFPVADGEDAWSAEEAIIRFLDSGAPPERLTVSSDGGGCLPVFDADGRVAQMDIGDPAGLPATLAALVARGVPLATALLPFTANPARLLRLPGKGVVRVDGDADLVVLDSDGGIHDVMSSGTWHVRAGEVIVRGPFEAVSS
jgi:beta-aspartyl-dipeptidase (metallo-type)